VVGDVGERFVVGDEPAAFVGELKDSSGSGVGLRTAGASAKRKASAPLPAGLSPSISGLIRPSSSDRPFAADPSPSMGTGSPISGRRRNGIGLNIGVEAPGGISDSSSAPASDDADEDDDRVELNMPAPVVVEGGT
jgi:hypothetical protein